MEGLCPLFYPAEGRDLEEELVGKRNMEGEAGVQKRSPCGAESP